MDRAKDVRNHRSIKGGSSFLSLDSATLAAQVGDKAGWLAEQIREAVNTGHLAAGERLPPSRVLATELGVSRGIITDAYTRLADAGLVAALGRGGTVVCGGPSAVRPTPKNAARIPTPDPFGSTADFETLRAAPCRIDLSPGVPDVRSFPRAAWLRAERTVLSTAQLTDLAYGQAQGALPLRTAISRWVARTRGITCLPDDVIVVAGVAQALSLLAHLLKANGADTVAVEDPGSLGARQQLNAWGIRTPAIPVDEDGLDVDALQRHGAAAVMVTPAHQFPTGVVLTGQRRVELLEWARNGNLVIEDDYDAEHRYDRRPVPALAADEPESVYYMGSVSKILAPALRIGWIIAPRSMTAAIVDLKRDTDLGNATVPQLSLAHLMNTGDLERHLRTMRSRHRRRRDVMIGAVQERIPHAVIVGAAAGLHLTILLPDGLDDTTVAAQCLQAGVKLHPLSWHRQCPGPPGLVLGYAASTEADITKGIDAVARAAAE
ncbi:PLP-dependent aminotransferase family protein [Antrihabitans sp. NCIMB 15449]|uniref:PLP-dependent aminotransferase family protein n=1 Tax=Antrihabitans spumae TaxID=3373370 RepID=A0ABW7JV42_9NOCA